MDTRRIVFPLVAMIVLAPFLLSPNPFGTLLLGVGDEEVFVRTALSALSHATLPGLDFSDAFRAPYGALQSYLVYVALIPAYLWQWLALGSSQAALDHLSAHAGELLQLVRWLNGMAGLLAFALAVRIALVSDELRRRMWFFGILLLSSTLFISIAHTGKMWFMQAMAETVAGLLVIAVEGLRTNGRTVPRWYLPALVWLTVAALSQSFMGAGAGLWIIYAIYLEHIRVSEVSAYIRANLLRIAIIFLLQASIIHEGYLVSTHLGASITDVTGVARQMPLADKLLWPITVAAVSAPLSLAAWLVSLLIERGAASTRRYHVAIAHPIIVYGTYFIACGFPHTLRYLLPLSCALTLSATLLVPARVLSLRALLALSLPALAIATSISLLWWAPSAETRVVDLVRTLPALDDRRATLFVEPEQLFPLAGHSEANLLHTRALIARHETDRDLYETQWRYLFARDAESLAEYRLRAHVSLGMPVSGSGTALSITDDCMQRCTPDESCLSINAAMCDAIPDYEDTILTIPGLLKTRMLGQAYFVRHTR
jgi:hypothetical protein